MSSMPTVAPRTPHAGTRKPLYMSAAIALVVEALLLAGVGAWLVHPHITVPRRPPEPMTIVLTPTPTPTPTPRPAPKPAPTPAHDEPKPVPKPIAQPVVQPRRAAPAHVAHVAHATPPKAQPQPVAPPPPAPAPMPDATPVAPAPAPTAVPTEASPAARPAPAPAASGRADASFAAALRAAIQAALRYPQSARMDGTSGRTLVAFVYRDGSVSDIRVVTSSGMGLLDHAAVAAVRDAVCPPPPPGMAGKNLPEQLWVDFRLDGNG